MSSGKNAVKVVFSEKFEQTVKDLSKDGATIRAAVKAIIAAPLDYTEENDWPRTGGFERDWGYFRIVYTVCGECRKRGFGAEHTECADFDDDTVYFRYIYSVI